jgi:hypothetical protein
MEWGICWLLIFALGAGIEVEVFYMVIEFNFWRSIEEEFCPQISGTIWFNTIRKIETIRISIFKIIKSLLTLININIIISFLKL